MASKRQCEANRRNGSKGGPKTAAGKERSRLNSLKHGLTASTLVVLPEENAEEYKELLRSFRDSLLPEGGAEDALVLLIAQSHWRSLRSRAVETGMLNTTANAQRRQARTLVDDCREHLDLHEAIGVGFMVMPAERWLTYLRYDTTISREFYRALEALTRLQRLRQHKTSPANNTPPDKTASAAPQSPLVYTAAARAELSDSGIGSVSQNRTSIADREPCASDLQPTSTTNESNL
jgi:hypothetical protein